MADPRLKTELVADLDRARAGLARNCEALRRDLDVGTRLRASFHHNKAAYIGGAGVMGLLLSKLPARRKKIYVDRKSKEGIVKAEKAGLWFILFEFLFKALRPMLATVVAKGITEFVRARGRSAE